MLGADVEAVAERRCVGIQIIVEKCDPFVRSNRSGMAAKRFFQRTTLGEGA
jgi:hypothetical protein